MPPYLSSIWAMPFFYHFSILHLSHWAALVWIHSELALHLALLALSTPWFKQTSLVRWSGSLEQGRYTSCRSPVSSPALLYTRSCGILLNFRVDWMASSSLVWWSNWALMSVLLLLMVCIVHYSLYVTSIYILYFIGAMQVMLGQYVANSKHMGTALGIGQMLTSGMRSISPVLVSSLFSISLQRHLAGGNLVFYILMGSTLLIVRISHFLPYPPSIKQTREPRPSSA